MPDSKGDDREARRARADAIRRARDKRNESLTAPPDAAAPAPKSENAAKDAEPNYVDFIDRKMRQPKKP